MCVLPLYSPVISACIALLQPKSVAASCKAIKGKTHFVKQYFGPRQRSVSGLYSNNRYSSPHCYQHRLLLYILAIITACQVHAKVLILTTFITTIKWHIALILNYCCAARSLC